MADQVKQQPWLISIEYRPVEMIRRTGGHIEVVRGDLTRSIVKSDIPPWKLLAEQAMKLRRVDAGDRSHAGEGLTRAGDEITAIFWAVQVPIGGLTEEEIDALS